MKRKITFALAASVLLLASCGGDSSQEQSVSSEQQIVSSVISTESTSNSENVSNQESSAEPSSSDSSSSSKPSSTGTQSSTSGNSSTGSHTSTGGNSSSIDNPSTIIDPETGEIIDLNGYVEVAQAPEGVVLTDWTNEMKAIFVKYLGGVVPPFMWMEGLMVSYDDLGILQAKGKATTGIAEEYAQILMSNGYLAYSLDEEKCSRTYGRGIGNGFMVSVDGLAQNGIYSVNYDIDYAKTTWPSDGIAVEFNTEIYGYTTTVVPAYEYEGAQYYPSANGFGEIDILCLGAPLTSVEEYTAILEDAHWQTAPYGDEGMMTATSRDKKVVMIYYHDGTGLQIVIGPGEGENYTTWADCTAAINDFGRTELRLDRDIADEIVEVEDAELYEIDRSIRGSLQITAYRTISYKLEDIMNYAMAAMGTGKVTYKAKGDYHWLLANDQSYAIRMELLDYVSDTVATTSIVFTLCDYRIYEGGYVYYGVWPEAQCRTISKNINPDLVVPGYYNEDATYYAFSDYQYNFRVEIVNPGNNALELYKAGLEDYSFTVSVRAEGGYQAIDRDETAKVCFYMEGDEMVVTLEKFIKSTVNNGKAAFNFKNTTQLESSTGWTMKTWSNGSITFKVEQNTSNVTVGNMDTDFLANPLRLYKGQKVTISTSEGELTKLEFYVTDQSAEKRTIKNFDASYLKSIAIEGATFETYNDATGLVRFNVNPGVSQVSFVVAGSYMQSNGGFGLTGLDVFFAA